MLNYELGTHQKPDSNDANWGLVGMRHSKVKAEEFARMLVTDALYWMRKSKIKGLSKVGKWELFKMLEKDYVMIYDNRTLNIGGSLENEFGEEVNDEEYLIYVRKHPIGWIKNSK